LNLSAEQLSGLEQLQRMTLGTEGLLGLGRVNLGEGQLGLSKLLGLEGLRLDEERLDLDRHIQEFIQNLYLQSNFFGLNPGAPAPPGFPSGPGFRGGVPDVGGGVLNRY
jgi:hypothetical protein